MKREPLEHIPRVAAALTRESEFVVLGSQSLLGVVPDLPPPLDQSMEPDLYPANKPEAADLIDGSIGEMSVFHETCGYYAHGVGPETALLPSNWRSRVIRISNPNTGQATGLCLSPEDLAVSELLAGRPKDLEFARDMLSLRLTQAEKIRPLLCECSPELQNQGEERLSRLAFPQGDRIV